MRRAGCKAFRYYSVPSIVVVSLSYSVFSIDIQYIILTIIRIQFSIVRLFAPGEEIPNPVVKFDGDFIQ
jgi:hypothetical protein